MITSRTIAPPKIVQSFPPYIQQAYIREFCRVEEMTHNTLAAKAAADNLLEQLCHRATTQLETKVGVSIIARVCEMSATDILPASVLLDIKQKDPHPFFAVYDVGGEGISTGTMDNKKERKIWSFAAIKELARKLKEGTAGIIIGHNKLNEDAKQKYGRIVHAFTKSIKDSLHALAVAYIFDRSLASKIEARELDVCSIEGDVVLARTDPRSTWFIKSVDNIQNLALGSSSVSSPGFAGAGVLATIQEMGRHKK